MRTTLRVLIVEDSEDDAVLLLRELRRGAWEVAHERVDTPAAMSAALDRQEWDLIIADYSMPNFSGPDALAMANGRASDVPFILVSGAVGEETAVLAMKAGADDYLSKGNLARLVPAVERELREAQGRRNAARVAEQLHKRESQLADALHLARLGTWHWDLTTGAAVWSDEACAMVNDKPGTPGPTFNEFVNCLHPEDRAAFTELIQDPKTKQFAQDFRLLRDDGEVQFVYICGDIIRNAEGAPSEITGMIQDVTERRRIDEELSKAKDAAEAANKSKSEFLANMSHEIRTPMGAILGFANVVIYKEQSKEERIECVQIIKRNALHLLELINEILDLSKIEASQMTVERIECDLPDLLSEIILLMRPRAQEKGLEFTITFDGPIPRLIQTDPLRLRQILVNLVGNAVKFTNTGKIGLRITDEGADGDHIMLRVDVSDTGIGLAQEQLDRLFKPFTQADQSITRKFGGTGLGLTISRRLARLLQGDLTVESEPGVGSTFTLKIAGGRSEGVDRLHDLTESTLPAKATEGVHTSLRLRGHVLLVEDGRDNQRLLRMLLEDAGAKVDTAVNGKIAVELASTRPFDLILMDMQMPVMDGYAATIELRRKGLTIPIIALTAHAMSEDRAKCMASGCTDYLSKPINEEALLKTVNQHLGNVPSPEPEPGMGGAPQAAGASENGNKIKSSLASHPRVMKILPEFVDGLPGEVRKMTDLLERNDLASLQMVVHQLLGAAGGYGFDPVSEPALKAEESIKAGKDVEQIAAEVKSLIEVIRRIDGYDESKVSAAEKPAT